MFTRASELNHTRTEQQLNDCKKKTNEGVSDRSFSLISLPSYSKQKQSERLRSLCVCAVRCDAMRCSSNCLLLREYLYIFLSFFPHSFYTKMCGRYFLCDSRTYPPSLPERLLCTVPVPELLDFIIFFSEINLDSDGVFDTHFLLFELDDSL